MSRYEIYLGPSPTVFKLLFIDSTTGNNSAGITMELADRAVGFLLSFISISIFTYYTFWVIILVSLHSIQLELMFQNLNKFVVDFYFYAFLAICGQQSLYPQVLSTARICHSHSCICRCDTSLLLVRLHRFCDAQIQKEEGLLLVWQRFFNWFLTHYCLKSSYILRFEIGASS